MKEEAIRLLKEYDGVAPCSYIQREMDIPMTEAIALVREIQREQARKTWFEWIGEDMYRMARYMVYYNADTDKFCCTFDDDRYDTEIAAIAHTLEMLRDGI